MSVPRDPSVSGLSANDELDLHHVAERTLGHYEANAARFWEGTKDHDVRQNLSALLDAIASASAITSESEQKSFRILDFGCGPGRDLETLRSLGHGPVGLEGCEAFVRMARAHSSCEVLHQSFFSLELPELSFDGVFANASLFHVPRTRLSSVLTALHRSLVPGGVLFASNPRSFDRDHEGFHGDRYGTYLTVDTWQKTFEAAGFRIERSFLRPAGRPEHEQPWCAIVGRKTS